MRTIELPRTTQLPWLRVCDYVSDYVRSKSIITITVTKSYDSKPLMTSAVAITQEISHLMLILSIDVSFSIFIVLDPMFFWGAIYI